MSDTDLVRNSRDGDQFHYLWAARRCLYLISPAASMAAISIEGASPHETPDGAISAGEVCIDVGEYYGTSSLSTATSVRYIQLKHSTAATEDEWTMSGLEGTLAGFALRYKKLEQELGATAVRQKISFVFTTNRPISHKIVDALADAKQQSRPQNKQASEGLEKYTGLTGTDLAAFAALFILDSETADFRAQDHALKGELGQYLPDADRQSLLLLKDLVTRKATSEFQTNPLIKREDVLTVFGLKLADLFPARTKIKVPDSPIVRDSEISLVHDIASADRKVSIVHGDKGVGKSVFAARISQFLPKGSVSVVYDCYGNGEYQSPSYPRHQPRQSLVQIANELASQLYCHPLIPTVHAKNTDYYRAFLYRIEQAICLIRQKTPSAMLWIVIDGAEYAEMGAVEAGEAPSFARQLIRETLPEGVRLVLLCCSANKEAFNLTSDVQCMEFAPFSRGETAQHLRLKFSAANDHEVDEFHRLTSSNPSEQARALKQATELASMLDELGKKPENNYPIVQSAHVAVPAISIDEIAKSIADFAKVLENLRPIISQHMDADMARDVNKENLVAVQPFVDPKADQKVVHTLSSELKGNLVLAPEVVVLPPQPVPQRLTANYQPTSLNDHLLAFLNANNSRGFMTEEMSGVSVQTVSDFLLEFAEFDYATEYTIKGKAKKLKNLTGKAFKHGHCLDILSVLFGYRNWHEVSNRVKQAGFVKNRRRNNGAQDKLFSRS